MEKLGRRVFVHRSLLAVAGAATVGCAARTQVQGKGSIDLPAPGVEDRGSLAAALAGRRSVRRFTSTTGVY